MARRESRATWRRLARYAGSVALGVAALVAIGSFRAATADAVAAESRTLLGADLHLSSRSPFGPEAQQVIRALEDLGSPVAYVTRFSAMALAERVGRTRMVYVQAVAGEFPFYGEIRTEPAGLWQGFRTKPLALVDPAVLIQLGAEPGDTLAIGAARFTIRGTVTRAPGDIGLRNAVAPRVFIPARYLDETGLLQRGSLVRYSAYFALRDAAAARTLIESHGDRLRSERVRSQTARQYERDLTSSLGRLAGFLGLVGLAALLLGGVGVATGVHVFAREKLDTAATLRCLGARQRDVFAIYLLQAGGLGLVGGAFGTALGIGVQALLPRVMRDLLPLEVPFVVELPLVLIGLGLGVGVSLLFAVLPLLEIRGVAPLRALRRDFESPAHAPDPWRRAAVAAMGASLLAASIWQAPDLLTGIAFAAGLVATVALLGLCALALVRAARRFCPARAPYWLRQGIANLFRPHNQTMSVTLALGFGVFLIAVLHIVQINLLAQLTLDRAPDRPNLALFDIQPDQEAELVAMLTERDAPILERTSIVPGRIARLRGENAQALLADAPGERGFRWALGREYRLTYRPDLRPSERLVAGRWWDRAGRRPPSDTHGISVEEDLAGDLGLSVGDLVSWDIQGVPVESRVTSLRRVNWARFETNFFVVFEPGVLEDAPRSQVLLSRLTDPAARARLQRDLVVRFPNISAVDAAVVLEALDAVLARVAFAIRFMAAFTIASGLIILTGAISTSRYQRARESVLLRTLGGPGQTIRRILATEYLALGLLAAVAGVSLACVAAWALMHFLFEQGLVLPVADLALIVGFTSIVTATIGLLSSRDALKRTPLAGIREIADAQ